jgi:WD40 repeat protein
MAAALSSSKTSTTVEHTGASNTKEKERLLTCCHVLYGHEAPVSCIAFSSVLDIKLSGSVDGVIVAHSVRRAKFIRAIHVWDNNTDRDSTTTGNDSCADYAENEGQNVLQKGNSTSSCANRSFSRGRAAVRKLVLDNSGIFVAHLEDGMLQMFTINGVRLCTADAGEKLNAMDICPGGEMLVTGGENCHVVIRTLHDLAVRCVLDLSSHGPIRCISFTPPEMNPAPQFMYIGTDDGRLTVVDRDPQQTFEEEYVDGGLPMWRVHDGATEEKLFSNTWWTR